jgi:hypothetical protein
MIIKVETVVNGDPMDHFVMIEHAVDIQAYNEHHSEIWDEWYAEIKKCYWHHDMLDTFITILEKYNIDADNVADMVEDTVIGCISVG